MENLSIIDWELHSKIMEKRFGKNEITKDYQFNKDYKQEYLNKNKYLFHLNEISFKDNNEIIVLESYLKDRKKYYYNKNLKTLHNDYPTNKENLINEEYIFFCVVEAFINFIENKEKELDNYKKIFNLFLDK